MAGPLTLSMKELDRLQVLTRIAERRLTRRRAAGLLQIGERQVRRLYRAFVQDGAAGLVSRRRGRPSPRRLPAATQERALALIRERYADLRAHVRPSEAHRGARPRPVRRDAARLDECRRPVGPAGPARPPELSAAGASGLPRRARPARWQRARLVRGSRPALPAAGSRRRRRPPPHGTLL